MSWLDRINEQDQADPSFRPSYDTPLPFEGSDVAAGAERGGFGLRSALSGAVGDTRGAEYYGARASGTPTRFNSYKDVDPLSLDVIDYVQQVGGEQAPNMALMAATGGVAGAAAKSLMAGRVGAGAASGMMQFGEMSNELRQQGLEPTAVTAGAAALGGALDVIGLESLTKGMLKSAVGEQIKSEVQANAATRALRGAFGGFIEGVKNELPAELSQEVLAVGNRAYSDPNYLKKTDEIADRFAETAAATTAFAGPLGAAPGAVGGMRSATPGAPPVTPEASDTSVLDRVRGTPAPSHDMTLDELRALDSSTSSGETYGESQNAAKESTLPPNETGQRQEVLKGAGASAPATSSRAQRAFQYFQDKGLPSHTAAGIVGALTGESSRELSPGIVNPNSGAFGIAQWLGSRVKELDAFAKARGKPVDDFDTQLDFVWHELNNKEAGAFAQVKKAPDALTASDLFTTKFERPGKHELRLEPRRAAALDLLNGKAVGTTQAQAGATTVVQQRAENPALTAAEDAEMARRKVAEEPTYQSTKLGLAYRDGVLDGDTEKTGQVDSDDPFRLGATEDKFTLTFKGKKQESRGDDVFKPARPLPETGDDTFEGVTTESTPVRAFTQLYPAAKVTETSDPTDYSKIVSVTLPKTDARDDNEATTAGRVFEALISGTKDKVEKKIKLEHPDVLSKDSGNPIEIPVTRDGLAKIGRALDPGAYDDKPASAYAAAMSGLTHLIYDKGFTPRGVDTSKPNALEAWVKQQIGEQPVDRTPERATPEQEDRPVTGPVMGTARAEGQTPAPEAGGFTGEDPAPRVEYESKPGYTPVQQAALNHITTEAKRIQQALGPEATDGDRVKAWETAVNQVVRQTNPATITVAPETAYYELGADGKPQRVVTQSDTDGAPGNPSVDAAVLGREFESPEQARQALASAGYESLPQLKGPRQFIAMKEANKSTFRLVKTPEGKFRLTTANKATPGLERPRTVTRRELIQIADLAKREFSSALYARRMNAERDQIGQEAGQNPESMPLRDELSEDQLLADEERIGIAEDRAEMADRQRGLTSSFSPAEAKDQTRRSAENAINRVEDTAKRTRELDNQSIETVHKVSGGATIRATGVAEQVVKFFTDALKNIGLEVPLRVMSKAGIAQHIAALDLRIDGLMKAAEDANASLEGMPGVTGEQRKARKEQSKVLELRSRQLMDAMEERKLLQQAQEDEFAARVIYNDHYLDAARRTPVIVISDEAMGSKNLNIVLAHELGHVVQRAWFDQLPADLQKDIIKELSQDGRYTDDIAEAFADKFMEWYRLNERAQKVRSKQEGIQGTGMEKALRRLADALKRLWNNLVGHDNAFARRYPKFDEFLRSTVGVYGRMKPINPRINRLWTESLAQPYGGLPLVAADSTQFNNMSSEEYRGQEGSPSITIKGAGAFPDLSAAERAGVFSPTEILVLRELNEYDGFGNDDEAEALRELLDAVQENEGEFLTEGNPEEMLKALKGLVDKVSYSKGSLRFAAGPLAQKGAEQLGRYLWSQYAHQTSASDVLRFYMDSGADSFYKGLAKSLLEIPAIANVLVKAGGAPKTGQWNPALEQVSFDFRERRGVLTGDAGWPALFHELVHAATIAVYEKDEAAAAEINRLYEIAKTEAANKGLEFYGLKNPVEFMAELKTNREFQDFLANIREKKGGASVFSRFISWLRTALKFKGPVSVLEKAVSATDKLIDDSRGLQDLRSFGGPKFYPMTAGEFAQTAVDGAKAGIDRAARYAENKAGENVIGQRYIRKTNETVDAFKKAAAVALMADGTWLRNAGNGILSGYANIVAPIKGRMMKDMQVIGKVLVRPALSAREPAVYASTEAMNGSIQTLSDQQYGAWRKKLDPILEKVSKLSSTDYKALVEDLRDETTPSKTPIARGIRKYFAEMLMYMRQHDVKVGARSGYYTKAWDLVKLDDNKDAVIESFEQVFAARDELPVDPRVKVREGQEPVKFSTPRAAALYEYQRVTTGRVDNLFEQTEEDVDPELRGPSFRYARKRMFTNEEYEQFDLNRWLNDDIAWTMNTYTQLGIKRAVQQQATGIPRAQLRNPVTRRYWEQRFTKAKLRPEVMGSPVASLELLLAEGVQDGRLSHDEYLEAQKRVMSVMGLTNVGSNPRARRWVNRILAYETLLTMTWSSFAQLADFGISVWRADSMDRVGKVIGQIMDKRTRAEQQELLRTIGLSLDELTRHALNSGLMTTDPMAKGTQILTEKFFRLNGMHFLSESNLMFASMLGQSYIKDYADKAVNGKTMEERDEAMKRLRELHPTLSPADALTGDFAANPLLQQALHEYVSQSHLHNQIGYTPRIFNDYRFSVFTQLKGFMFKYHNIVLRQMWERMKDRPDLLQAAIPMLTLAMATMPLAFVGMEAKEALRRRLFPKVKRAPKDKTPMQKFHDVLMASGMPGAYVGLFDSALEAPQHGQPGIVALAGPTVGHAFNISSRTADEWLPSSVPIVSSVPWIRSMARQGLRDTFGFGVRDEE